MFKWFMRVSVVVLCIASAWVNMPVVKVASGDVGTRNCRETGRTGRRVQL